MGKGRCTREVAVALSASGQGHKRQKQGAAPCGSVPYKHWISDYDIVSRWLAQYNLPALLKQHGGLVRIENFLPLHVADGILKALEAIPQEKWNDTSAREDYTQNNILHSFWSVKQAKGLADILRVFTLLFPDAYCTFSAARYDQSHHIAPHDDRAYTQVVTDGGSMVTCSRDIALIYYLTQDWDETLGGVLQDLEAGPGINSSYVPLFNSVVAFQVPRYHAVTAVNGPRPRYSIFGWSLQPGQRYSLYTGQGADVTARDNAHARASMQTEAHMRDAGTQAARKASSVAAAGTDHDAAKMQQPQQQQTQNPSLRKHVDQPAALLAAPAHAHAPADAGVMITDKLRQRLEAKVAARRQKKQA